MTLVDCLSETIQLNPALPAVEQAGQTYSYARLWAASARLADAMRRELPEAAGRGTRIGLLVRSGAPYTAAMWACWRLGCAAVPLGHAHPPSEWRYTLQDAGCALLLADPDLEPVLVEKLEALRSEPAALPPVCSPPFGLERPGDPLPSALPSWPRNQRPLPDEAAHFIYTSGSTGKPKGVVCTHAQLAAQVACLVHAWDWRETDRILNVLPLHHVHGMVNVYACAWWSSACILEAGPLKPQALWEAFGASRPSLFMAVPTVYFRLLQAWEDAGPAQQERWRGNLASLRLMVSGSAPLRPELWEAWKNLSGLELLERYGMSEAGMILSQQLEGPRRAGWVGEPLPGVHCRVLDDGGSLVEGAGQGELQVRSAALFQGYWNRPQATEEAFDGPWFRTGDIVERDSDGQYRIVGRRSTDILKTGGYKVAAPEIEAELNQHPAVLECAVVGIPHEEWGQQIAAALVLYPGARLDLETLRSWARERLPAYKLPARILVLEELPRNSMGKVFKPGLVDLFCSPAD